MFWPLVTPYHRQHLANLRANSPVGVGVYHGDGSAFLSCCLNLLRLCYCLVSTVTKVLQWIKPERAEPDISGTTPRYFTLHLDLISASVPLLFTFVLFKAMVLLPPSLTHAKVVIICPHFSLSTSTSFHLLAMCSHTRLISCNSCSLVS